MMKGLRGPVGLYEIFMAPKTIFKLGSKSFTASDPVNWHTRLGHAPEKAITQTVSLVKGLHRHTSQPSVYCEVCLDSIPKRESRKPVDKLIQGSRHPMDLVHSDLWRPIGIP